MVQLKVYKDEAALVDPNYANQWFLDLYETEPIKLNLSIEDITNADASSTFSRTFKVPGTRHNEEFFQNAYEVDGVDFDVTIKKPAIVLVDGAEFKRGHVRLQKIYTNRDKNTIEYELLFLGETRDFASRLADKRMCELVFRDSNGDLDLLPANDVYFERSEIIQSWQAYPQGATLTSGLHNGDILFPLIDHGNTYDDDGNVEQVIMGFASGTSANDYFNHQPIALERMKPMFRAKRTFDQIFEDAGYTYESQFLNSATFAQMYVSAFGNNASVVVEPDTVNEFTGWCSDVDEQGAEQRLLINDAENDPSNSFNTYGSGGSAHTRYDVGTGASTAHPYVMYAECFFDAYIDTSDYGRDPVDGRLRIRRYSQTGALEQTFTGSWGNDTTLKINLTDENATGNDYYTIDVELSYGADYDLVENCYWEVSQSPGKAYLPKMFDCEYKQVDFVKDILTAFRLVMEPDPNNKLNFFIEPWQSYIGSGDLHDWSKKLIQDKEVVLEPLFNTQSAEIMFDFQQDEDYANKYHYDSYKQVYGHLEFNSNNDLLKGTRKVELLGIAPTIMLQPESKDNKDYSQTMWPQIHTHEAEDNGTQHLPIRPKTRLLFYNGLKDIGPNTTGNAHWHLGTTAALTQYPQVSPYQSLPFLDTSGSTTPLLDPNLNLNWSNDIKYFSPVNPAGVPAGYSYDLEGFTLYDAYWNRYISSLYNKFSRRMTAYFTLDNTDLQYLTFDDIIFVNGKYWRPEKIIDAQIGRKTAVKCQLISLKDYRPGYTEETLDNFSVDGADQQCGGACDGTITVTTNGTPPFTWSLDNGQTGTYNAPVGQAPYEFEITVCPGVYTVSVEDAVGRTGSDGVIINATTAAPIYASHEVDNPSNCVAPCDGEIRVIAGGGTPNLTISWADDPTTNFIRTGLCPGSYTYQVEDANGCTIGASILLECVQGPQNYELRQFQNGGCAALGTTPFIVESYGLNIGDVYGLATSRGGAIDGCFQVISVTSQDPTHILDVAYLDCEACQNSQPTPTPTATPTPTPTPTATPTPTPTPATSSYQVQAVDFECTANGAIYYIPEDPTLTVDTIFKIRDDRGVIVSGCFKWVASSLIAPNASIFRKYGTDCVSCLRDSKIAPEF